MGNVTRVVARLGTGEAAWTITVRGRAAWCFDRLVQSGERGVTPIEYPAPRWSDYVFKLRKQGVPVQTIEEKHGGTYRGTHARYVLTTPVEVISVERAA